MEPVVLIAGQNASGKTYIARKLSKSLRTNNWTTLEFLNPNLSELKALQGRTPLIVNLKSFVIEHLFATDRISLAVSSTIPAFRQQWQQTLDAAYAAHGQNYFIIAFVARVNQLLLENPNHVVIVPDLHYHRELEFIGKHFAITKVLVSAPDRSAISRDEEYGFDLGRMLSYQPHNSETDFAEYLENKELAIRHRWIWFDNDLERETEKALTVFKKNFPEAPEPVLTSMEDIEKLLEEKHSL